MTLAKLNRDFESAHRRYHALPERSEKRSAIHRDMVFLKLKMFKAEERLRISAAYLSTRTEGGACREALQHAEHSYPNYVTIDAGTSSMPGATATPARLSSQVV